MAGKDAKKPGEKVPENRQARLKAALKANIAKRKAQARARSALAVGPGKDKD